jgi:hypothetical protein
LQLRSLQYKISRVLLAFVPPPGLKSIIFRHRNSINKFFGRSPKNRIIYAIAYIWGSVNTTKGLPKNEPKTEDLRRKECHNLLWCSEHISRSVGLA